MDLHRPLNDYSGLSGHLCRGYRRINSFRTCGYNLSQNPLKSDVTCTGLWFGANKCTTTACPLIRGDSCIPKKSCSRDSIHGGFPAS